MPMETKFNIIDAGKHVFDIEVKALEKTRDTLDETFEQIVQCIIDCRGKVVLTGMGKPGHIATKIAASLASLGTPSFFMHPAEAMHGDLGMLAPEDVVILMSYSGESIEVTSLLPVLAEIGCTTIAIKTPVYCSNITLTINHHRTTRITNPRIVIGHFDYGYIFHVHTEHM